MRTSPAWMAGRLTGISAGLLLNLHPSTLSGQGVLHQFREVHLGLEVTISAHGPRPRAEQAAAAAFARIAVIEQALSDWRPGSELNLVTAAAADGAWHPISADLETVLGRALQMAAATDGAFDPTIGALTRLWREERRTGIAADPERRAEAQNSVDWRGVELDTTNHRVRLGNPATRFDLGGIAKGWILEQARAVMAQHGISAVLLTSGGDLVAGDAPPGQPGWRVNIRTARGDSIIEIRRAAVATSGPSSQGIIDAAGRRRSHVIDPADGQGLDNDIELTVIAADGATADAVATALTVMPEAKWDAVLARFGVTLLAVIREHPNENGKRETGNWKLEAGKI